MSDELELSTLPIFPLPVVLVPGELLPLHIFEERYKSMMNDALEGEKRFGLSYLKSAEVGREAVPPVGSLGCVAHITAVVPLPGGRMNILGVGTTRYVIRSYTSYSPYLVAEVDPIADEPSSDDETSALSAEVRDLFARLAAAARTLSNEAGEQPSPELDVGPESLSFLVAANIALDNETKQQLLETTDTRARLEKLRSHLLELVETYEYRATIHSLSKTNGHGGKDVEVDDDAEE